jgi:hypothetical protein
MRGWRTYVSGRDESAGAPARLHGERSGGGAGGARLPFILFGQQALFSAGGLAGGARLPSILFEQRA